MILTIKKTSNKYSVNYWDPQYKLIDTIGGFETKGQAQQFINDTKEYYKEKLAQVW